MVVSKGRGQKEKTDFKDGEKIGEEQTKKAIEISMFSFPLHTFFKKMNEEV